MPTVSSGGADFENETGTTGSEIDYGEVRLEPGYLRLKVLTESS